MNTKKIILIFCFFLTNIFCSTAQINVLAKNETFIAPQQDMIVMDKYTFAKYHYTSEQYDSLKKEALSYDSTVEWMNSITQEVEQGYKNLVSVKDKQIQDYSQSYDAMKSTLQKNIDEQNKLQIDYIKLQQKQKRAKRWRNIFLGTAALLGGVIVLLIAK